MLTETKTVTINAAFLQEIKDDDVHYGVLLKETFDQCTKLMPSDVEPRKLASLLEDLRDQLAMHFALEEAYGYFEGHLSVAPRFSEKAVTLRCQHPELYEEVSFLAERAADIAAENLRYKARILMIRKLFVRVLDFHRRLKLHDAEETELIMDAYNVDIGGNG